MKVQIVLSEDRQAVRAELEAAGVSTEGVAELGYEAVPDAPKKAFSLYREEKLKELAGKRMSGLRGGSGRAEEVQGGIAHMSGKPDWLRVKAPTSPKYFDLVERVREKKLHTVCEEAACPNIGD